MARVRDGTPLALAGDPRSLKRRLRHLEDVTKHIQRLPDVDWVRVDEGGAIFGLAGLPAVLGQAAKPAAAARAALVMPAG